MAKELSQPTVYANTQVFPTDSANCKDTICKNAQTISFVERGFERLGLGHQAVGFSWCSYMVKFSSPLEPFSWRWAGRLWFLAIFPSLLYRLLTFPFIPACVHCPLSTCRFKLSKTDTCPISPYSKSLGGGCKNWRIRLCQVQSIEWQ